MGEYYDWINVDKKEYICPNDFDFGNKRTESLVRGNVFLSALYDLLSKEWREDHIFWMGDEKNIPEDTENLTLRILYEHTVQIGYPGCAFDTVCESYKNVSGLFKAAETEVRQEIGFYLEDIRSNEPFLNNEYGIDIEKPFDGLFLREGQSFKYVINQTRKVCYSCGLTKILYQNNTENDYADPLPILMAYGRVTDTGIWVGDVIGVADEIPEGYELLESVRLDW